MNRRKSARAFFTPLFLIAAAAVLLAAVGTRRPALAQAEEPLSMEVSFGLGGYCKQDAWIPVRVILENSGPDVEARIQVSYVTNGEKTINGQDLLLPSTSRKETFLYFYPHGTLRDLRVSLVEAGGKTAQAKANEFTGKYLTERCIPADSLLVGVVADRASAFDSLPGIHALRGPTRKTNLRLEDLPDRPQGWSMLDALIIAGVDTGQMSEAQKQAMQLWIANGGKLLVIGGPGWQAAAAGLQELLPLEAGSTQSVSSLSVFGSYLPYVPPPEGGATLTVGRPRPGSQILLEQDGIPLLLERQIGFGRVIYLAADPSLRPLSGWAGMDEVYSQLIGTRSARPSWLDGSWEPDPAERAASTINATIIPSYVYICGWLVLYVVVVGPINFFILRRMKRRELAWLTVPAVVLAFTAVAYLYGAFDRGSRPALNRIAIVQSWEGVERAEARALVGLYSPRRTSYTLQSGDGFMLLPFSRYGVSPEIGGGWLALQDGESSLLPGTRVEIGGMRIFTAQGNPQALQLDHNLVLTLSHGSPVLSGTLTNTGTLMLKDAVLVTAGNNWQELGDLPPGESRNIRLMLTGWDGGDFYYQDAEMMLGYDYDDLMRDADAIRRTQLLDAAVLASRSGPNAANGGVYLMAWSDQPSVPLEIQGKPFDRIDTTLYISMLNPEVKWEGSLLRLTPGLFLWESSQEGVSPYMISGYSGQAFVLQFHLAFPLQFSSVEELQLNMHSQGTNIQDVSAQLWDYQAGRWVKLSTTHWGTMDVPEPARFVGPGGELRLQLDNLTSNWFGIEDVGFVLTVGR